MVRQNKLRSYEAWEETVRERIKAEPIWAFIGYRKSLFLCELAWEDCEQILKDERGKAVAHQLIRAAGSS